MSIGWLETIVEITPGTANAWTDADVSAYIPAGATGVILHFVNPSGDTYTIGARKNGSTDNRIAGLYTHVHCWGGIGVDGSRILELYVGHITEIDIYLVGYFQAESVFFTNAPDKSLSVTGAWTDIDISADTGADTALQAIFEVCDVDFAYETGFRQNGSTDARINSVYLHNMFGVIIGVDGSEICESYIGNVEVDFFLVGYIKSEVVSLTNATNLSLDVIDAWTDLSVLPSDATGGWIEVAGGLLYSYGLRENGSAEDVYRYCKRHHWGLVKCDASRIIEGKIDNVDVDFFLVGYPTPTTAVTIEASIPISPILSGTIEVPPSSEITASIPISIAFSGTIMRGNYGDIESSVVISPVLSGTLEIPLSITASIPISPILSGMIDTIPRIAVSILINIDISGVLTSIESGPGIDVTLPTLQFNGTGICDCIGHFNTAIPSLISNIQGYFNEIGTLDANIPGPRFSASGLTGEVGDLAVLLPMLALNAKAEVSEVGNLSVTLPSLTCKMTLEEDLVGNLILTLPFQRIALNGYLSAFGNLAVTIPMLKLSLSATPFSYLNLVMNIRNRALTEYTNYNFNSFCRFNGKHLGATSTKIHDLDTGDTDDGDLIDWNFRTGYLDLEQKFKKRLRQAWFSYKSNGDLIVTIVLPAGTEYEYDLEGYEETENGVRVKFGKGIRSKYIALDVRNVTGSSVVIDALRLHFEKSGGVR